MKALAHCRELVEAEQAGIQLIGFLWAGIREVRFLQGAASYRCIVKRE